LEHLLHVTESLQPEQITQNMIDSAVLTNDKGPQWTIWIGGSVWENFKHRKAELQKLRHALTNSQVICLLLQMKAQINIPDPAHFKNQACKIEDSTSSKMNRIQAPCKMLDDHVRHVSRMPVPYQMFDNHSAEIIRARRQQFVPKRAVTPYSDSREETMRICVPPILDQHEPLQQPSPQSDQEQLILTLRPLPTWLANLVS
jgi:hypothetical protein